MQARCPALQDVVDCERTGRSRLLRITRSILGIVDSRKRLLKGDSLDGGSKRHIGSDRPVSAGFQSLLQPQIFEPGLRKGHSTLCPYDVHSTYSDGSREGRKWWFGQQQIMYVF